MSDNQTARLFQFYAERAMKSKDWLLGAEFCWASIVNGGSATARLYAQLSCALRNLGEFQSAQNIVQRGMKFCATDLDAELIWEYCAIAFSQGDWSEALVRGRAYLALFSDRMPPVAFRRLVKAYRRLGLIDEADRVASIGRSFWPKNRKLMFEWARLKGGEEGLKRWQSVLEICGNRRITPNVLVAASKAFYNAGDYEKANTLLSKALQRDPANLQGLLEKKKRAYKEALHVWRTGVASHSSDYGSDKGIRPDWQEVADCSQKLVSIATGKHLRFAAQHFIQAALFRADEISKHLSSNIASAIIKDALGFLCPGAHALEICKRVGDLIENGHSEQLETLVVDSLRSCSPRIMTVNGWLGIYDVLVWNGYFMLGSVARKKAIECAYLDAEDSNLDENAQVPAFEAALEEADFESARKYLQRIESSSCPAHRLNPLKAYFLFCKGDTDTARALSMTTDSRSDPFFQYVKNRSIAIVGPVPTHDHCGDEIDSFDTVVRFNYLGQSGDASEFGRRTDVSYYPYQVLESTLESGDAGFLSHLTHYRFRNSSRAVTHSRLVEDKEKGIASDSKFISFQFHKGPVSGPLALFDILHGEPRRIKLFKTTFYLSAIPYSSDYLSGSTLLSSIKAADVSTLHQVFMGHDFLSQVSFVRNLWRSNVIEVDQACQAVLELSDEEYMAGMESIYGSRMQGRPVPRSHISQVEEEVLLRFAKDAERRGGWYEAAESWRMLAEQESEYRSMRFASAIKAARRAKDYALAELIVNDALSTSSVNLDTKIEIAELAMDQLDWPEAVRRWNDIKDDLLIGSRAPALLRASVAYRNVDDFVSSEECLLGVLRIDPENKKARRLLNNQNYSRAVADKVMDDNWGVVNWSSANSDMKFAEDWIRLSARFDVTTEGVSAKYVQARLYAVSKFLTENRKKDALEVIRSVLSLYSNKISHDILQQIIQSTKVAWEYGASPCDGTGELSSLVSELEPGRCTYEEWLFLYDILAWVGLLRVGLEARKKAEDRALMDASQDDCSMQCVDRAFRVSIERLDSGNIARNLERLEKLNLDSEALLKRKAYAELLLGNYQGFQDKWPEAFGVANKRFEQLIRSRSVAIVGPAPTGELCGEDIDNHDIVIRFNYTGKKNLPDKFEFGQKINVSMYNKINIDYAIHQNIDLHLSDLDLYTFKKPKYDFLIEDWKQGAAKLLSANEFLLNKVPLAGTDALFEALKVGASKIKLFKSNFLLADSTHSSGYIDRKDTNNVVHLRINRLHNTFPAHDLISNLRFVRALWKAHVIQVDSDCARVLAMTDEEYMAGMEETYC